MKFLSLINKKFSPRTYLLKNIYEPLYVPKPDRRKKISADDFYIPTFSEWGLFITTNYNVSQLKKMARFYKQKVSGNKKELVTRLYNFLKLSNHTIKIQSLWRGYLRRKYNYIKGFENNPKRCTNITDFLSLTELDTLSYPQFFSYKDEDGFIYGFDIKSIYNLVTSNAILSNPYNRKLFPKNVIDNINNCIRLSRVLNEKISIDLHDGAVEFSPQKRMELKAISLFHKIDSFGHITDSKWFLNLHKENVVKFLKELFDIWNYRAQLSQDIKYLICPPNGRPFNGLRINNLHHKTEFLLKKLALTVIENIITKSTQLEQQSLGAFYVLGALTLVSQESADSLPWLYQSVVHNS